MSNTELVIVAQDEELEEIRHHNALTDARYDMNSCEMDVFFYTLSQLKRETELPVRKYKIYVKDIEKKSGRKYNYKQFRESTSNIIGRVYEVPKVRPDGKINLLQVSLFASAEYITGEGAIEIELSEKILPFLFEIKNNFTSLSLRSALIMSSKYAKRIYQLLNRWKDIETKTYEVEELRIKLKLKDPKKPDEPGKYAKYSTFKINVLEVAKTEINELTDLKIDYEEIKKGRSVHSIRFFINQQRPKQLPLEFNDIDIEEAASDKERRIIEELKIIGIVKPELVRTISKDYSKEFWKWKHNWKIGNHGDVSSPSGHLLRILGLK